jgi:hypothetical protein
MRALLAVRTSPVLIEVVSKVLRVTPQASRSAAGSWSVTRTLNDQAHLPRRLDVR